MCRFGPRRRTPKIQKPEAKFTVPEFACCRNLQKQYEAVVTAQTSLITSCLEVVVATGRLPIEVGKGKSSQMYLPDCNIKNGRSHCSIGCN